VSLAERAVALCAIFSGSQVLKWLGGRQRSCSMLAFKDSSRTSEDHGRKDWWKTLEETRIQDSADIISSITVLDQNDRRICASFDMKYIKKQLDQMKNWK
jgi:hypothetical protein